MTTRSDTRWIEDSSELLTVAEMYAADAGAAARGVPTLDLMERAGAAIAEALQARWPDGRVLVLCGPGNNGGDGFVVARLLHETGRDVTLALLGETGRLAGDAAANAERWTGELGQPVHSLGVGLLDAADIVVDALFGAGLARSVEGVAREVIDAINETGAPCLAVDVPSGVHGDTGAVMGAAPRAGLTVTFFRRKPGHLLYPGRGLCGDVRVADIGIPEAVLDEIAPRQFHNQPDLWRDSFPALAADGHKYSRGHAVVAGGADLTGAARLASHAALRAGAGLVSIASPTAAVATYRAGRPSIMVRETPDLSAFADAIGDPRVRGVLVGPGNGVTADTRERTLAALKTDAACVIDADAITAFADEGDALFAAVRARTAATVLTPHSGEFDRLFGGESSVSGRLDSARDAAAQAGAVVVLKGADTVIAAPDGRAAINDNAPPTLATAGSGDVLAGFILGLLTQGMPGFEGASAGVWLHGAAAAVFGPGLIADDIADQLPAVLRALGDEAG